MVGGMEAARQEGKEAAAAATGWAAKVAAGLMAMAEEMGSEAAMPDWAEVEDMGSEEATG